MFYFSGASANFYTSAVELQVELHVFLIILLELNARTPAHVYHKWNDSLCLAESAVLCVHPLFHLCAAIWYNAHKYQPFKSFFVHCAAAARFSVRDNVWGG